MTHIESNIPHSWYIHRSSFRFCYGCIKNEQCCFLWVIVSLPMWWSYLCIGCSFTYLCIGFDSQCFKGCLPTRTLLQERCVPCPLVCPLCEHYNEDDWHILFKCNHSVQEGNVAGLDQIVAARIHYVNTLAEFIMDICQKEEK
jgi:hypothetical protein